MSDQSDQQATLNLIARQIERMREEVRASRAEIAITLDIARSLEIAMARSAADHASRIGLSVAKKDCI
jgi:hypothetical protein